MEGGVFLLGALFIGLVVAAIVWAWRAADQRQKALAALAAEMGLSFSAEDPFDLPERFGHLEVIDQGHDREASNVLHGEWDGRRVTAFDYEYKTGSGKDEDSHSLSVAVITCGCRFPGLFVRPEGFLDKVAGVLGDDDIDFESHEFSKKFYVNGPDRKFAYDVINGQMMEYLLGCEGWQIELSGSEAAIWSDEDWEPEGFRTALATLGGFLDRVPRFVWKDLGEDHEAARSSSAASGS
jgi:hypothetical protein